ncbi:twin-arginine translocation signal domain-containing protein [bacterium]|nr:twin-arginine translocation signal domain-containing protein [bacterium]
MKDPKKSTTGLNRRDALKAVTTAGLGLAAGGLGSSGVFAQASVRENRIGSNWKTPSRARATGCSRRPISLPTSRWSCGARRASRVIAPRRV